MVPARDRAVTRPLGGFSQQRRCRYLISRSCSNLQEHSSSIAAERPVIRVDRDRQICVLYVELEQTTCAEDWRGSRERLPGCASTISRSILCSSTLPMLSSSSCHGARLVERPFVTLCRYAWYGCSSATVRYLEFSNKQYRYRACVFIPWGSHSSGFNAVGVDNARE